MLRNSMASISRHGCFTGISCPIECCPIECCSGECNGIKIPSPMVRMASFTSIAQLLVDTLTTLNLHLNINMTGHT